MCTYVFFLFIYQTICSCCISHTHFPRILNLMPNLTHPAPHCPLCSFLAVCMCVCACVCVSFLSSKIAAEAAFSSRVGKQFSSHCWDVRKVRLKVCNGYQLNCNHLVAHATLLSTLVEWNAKSKFIDHTHSHTHATRKGMQRKNELSLVKMEHCFISLPKVVSYLRMEFKL